MFRFTIREVLLLTMIVGLAVGWWLDHRRHEELFASQRKEAGVYRILAKFMEGEGYRLIWQNDGNMLTILRPGESLP